MYKAHFVPSRSERLQGWKVRRGQKVDRSLADATLNSTPPGPRAHSPHPRCTLHPVLSLLSGITRNSSTATFAEINAIGIEHATTAWLWGVRYAICHCHSSMSAASCVLCWYTSSRSDLYPRPISLPSRLAPLKETALDRGDGERGPPWSHFRHSWPETV